MSESIRQTFDEQLSALEEDVVRMGSIAAQAVQTAIQALRDRDLKCARGVMDMENEIDALNLDIESRAIELLALQQPMARDLRTIASVLRIIADIERIGDYSVDICHQVRELADRPLMKPLEDIPHMADVVQQMLHESLRAFVQRDLDLATKAVERDDDVDRTYHRLHDELTEYVERDASLTSQAMSLLLIGAYLERMADHVTNIGERIWYMETGELKELHE